MSFLLPPEKTNSRETNTKSKNMMKKSSPREYFKLQDKTFQRGPVKNSTTVFDLLRDRISLESIQKSKHIEVQKFCEFALHRNFRFPTVS